METLRVQIGMWPQRSDVIVKAVKTQSLFSRDTFPQVSDGIRVKLLLFPQAARSVF